MKTKQCERGNATTGIVFVVLVIICLGLVGMGATKVIGVLRECGQVRRYVEGEGVVTKSGSREVMVRKKKQTRRYRYVVDVGYEYEVDGQRYESQRYQIVDVKHKHRPDDITKAYVVGEPCVVYYDADDPSKAVLVREILIGDMLKQRAGWITLVIVMLPLSMLFGYYGYYYGIGQDKKRKKINR